MLTALVLICSAARSNANTVMRVPAEFGNPPACFMHAQTDATRAKLCAVDPQAYFTDVLTKLVNLWPASRLDELMPWAWAAEHSTNKIAA